MSRDAKIQSAPGMLRATNAQGTSLSTAHNRPSRSHPFRVAFMGSIATVARGLVEYMEPEINGRPISDTRGGSIPTLILLPFESNPHSWICVEVTTDPDSAAEGYPVTEPPVIVHREEPTLIGGDTGRHPLAMVVWSEGHPVGLHQIEYFNLRYQRTSGGSGAGAVKHRFY